MFTIRELNELDREILTIAQIAVLCARYAVVAPIINGLPTFGFVPEYKSRQPLFR